MKKQHRGQIHRLLDIQLLKRTEKIDEKVDYTDKSRLRNKYAFVSPPNKENQLAFANYGSPASHSNHCHSKDYVSPSRTTPHEVLETMRSNKSKQVVIDDDLNLSNFKESSNPFKKTILSGISKDGKYRIYSIALQGPELDKAVQFQKKTTINCIVSAEKNKNKINQKLPTIQKAKVSTKQNGAVKAYGVNTHQGITRNYNEDRVNITLNIKKNGSRAQFFAIYDGHGGNACCDYLKENLHQFLIAHPAFPTDSKTALLDAIRESESRFCQTVRDKFSKQGQWQKSGSCALIVLIVDDHCYVANLGDSRAILSTQNGKYAFNLSRDHKPTSALEQDRIFKAKGKIYRTQMHKIQHKPSELNQPIIGPLRIYPGKLSVSRTIGDIQAKEACLGGVQGVISAEPDIRKFKLSSKQDFVMLCCDGILERMQSMEAIEIAWKAMRQCDQLHKKAGAGVDAVILEAMKRRSSDNLTAIIICLSDLSNNRFNNFNSA